MCSKKAAEGVETESPLESEGNQWYVLSGAFTV